MSTHLKFLLNTVCLLLLVLAGPAMAGPDCDDPKFSEHPKCGGGSGVDIPLSCFFWDLNGHTLLSDDMGHYVDGEEKVSCSTGGTSQPNLSGIGLATLANGHIKHRIRQLDLTLDYCPDADCIQPVNGLPPYGLPANMFESGEGNMENIWFAVRPYVDTQDHIQLLEPGPYGMALRVSLSDGYQGYRIVTSLAEREVANDKFQGVSCAVPQGTLAKMEDVLVIVRESSDAPVRFTVTTGYQGDSGIVEQSMKAAICSNMPIDGVPCEPTDDYGLCFMGLVYMRFTFDASELPGE